MSDIECSPGENIKECLNDRAWSQGELARRSGLSTKTVSELCNDKTRITARVALRLEKVFEQFDARFWMTVQVEHDLKVARARQRKRGKK